MPEKILPPLLVSKNAIEEFIGMSSNKITRAGKDMAGYFVSGVDGDALIYEVYEIDGPHQNDFGLTILRPGKVGDEFFMTKGHYHENGSADETYFCLSGEGLILLQSKAGETRTIELVPGRVAYVPPGWAHRSVNTGKEDFVFLAVFPKDAGHDYESIERDGFLKRVVDEGGKFVLKDGS